VSVALRNIVFRPSLIFLNVYILLLLPLLQLCLSVNIDLGNNKEAGAKEILNELRYYSLLSLYRWERDVTRKISF
jgi:hypothetical protein